MSYGCTPKIAKDHKQITSRSQAIRSKNLEPWAARFHQIPSPETKFNGSIYPNTRAQLYLTNLHKVFKWNKWTSWHSGFCRFPHGFPGILDSSPLFMPRARYGIAAPAPQRRMWQQLVTVHEIARRPLVFVSVGKVKRSWNVVTFHTRSVVFCEPCEQCQEVLFGWSQAMSALLGIPDCGEPNIKGNWGFFDFR